jgi:hypothetical protein
MVESVTTELQFGGPGAPPQPWVVRGATISYDGAVLVPSNVVGGNTGSGTINANDLYIRGVKLETLVGQYLPLTGGTLTGPLRISGPTNLFIGNGISGNVLASDGIGGTFWTANPPGGPYLKLTGGVLTGPLGIASPTNFQLGGGAADQVLSTNGAGGLSWINQANAGVSPIFISDTPPVGAAAGSLWFDTVGGQLYIYYEDANSIQWVIVVNSGEDTGGEYLPLAGGTLVGPLFGVNATLSDFLSVGGNLTGTTAQFTGALVGTDVYLSGSFNCQAGSSAGFSGQFVVSGAGIALFNAPVTFNQPVQINNTLTLNNNLSMTGTATIGGAITPQAGIAGVNTNSSAAAGQIGEVISAIITTPLSLVTSTQINLASIVLTPGDWDIYGDLWYTNSAAMTVVVGGISTVSATLPPAVSLGTSRIQLTAAWSAGVCYFAMPACRASVAVNTTYYLIAYAGFASGTCTAMGKIWARRAR